jgi:hypothetical protein
MTATGRSPHNKVDLFADLDPATPQDAAAHARKDKPSLEARLERAKESAAEYEKRTGKKRGLGRVANDAKAQLREEYLDRGVTLQNLPAPLRITGQLAATHEHLSDDVLDGFTKTLVQFPDPAIAANAVGLPGKAKLFKDLKKRGDLARHLKNPNARELRAIRFADAWAAAISHRKQEILGYANEELRGKLKPIVSMGQVVAHEHVRDTKFLAQVLKTVDPSFARANAPGGGTTVNIQNNVGADAGSDPNDPSFTFKLSETFPLEPEERRQLEAIASKIISNRRNEHTVIDLNPIGETTEDSNEI